MLCPICRKSVPEPGDAKGQSVFPFCSERCKLIDLGRWLSGKYQIPAADPEQADNESEQIERPE
jgi:endogenous inhibitor of DNA gyrase (YacG/DUF329 family)